MAQTGAQEVQVPFGAPLASTARAVQPAGQPAVQLAVQRVRSEVNNSLIIVNFFHKIQNFRQISDLFSQI